MKNLVLYLLFLTIALGSCASDENNNNNKANNSNNSNPYSNNAIITMEDVRSAAEGITGRMKYVVGHIWWYEGYVTSRQEYKSEQRGKWFQFNPDGTFIYGKWQEKLGEGTWRYEEDTQKLFTSTPGGTENLEWETMMSHTNDQMVWLGPPRGQNGGDQCMLRPYLQRPNPEDLPHWKG
jgi:hypothetical protein